MSHAPGMPGGSRILTGIVIFVAAAAVAGMILLWPGEIEETNVEGLRSVSFESVVLSNEEGPCPGAVPDDGLQCRVIGLRLTEGPGSGDEIEIAIPKTQTFADVGPGEGVILGATPGVDPPDYRILDRNRKAPLIWLAALFAIVVVALGRLRGLAALAGLAVSLLVLLKFVLPAILDGSSPLLVSIIGATVIAYPALYLAHGFSPMTTIALIGTFGGFIVAAFLASVFTELANISGFVTDEAFILQAAGTDINVSGLILGGIIIGALGAIDDAAVTQASSIWELSSANPSISRRNLFRSGMRIGSSHVASMVNTLVLAYAGASMPLFVLLVLSEQSLGTAANGEVIATEIIRTLVGSIGLIASVPITTWLAARFVPQVSRPGGAPARSGRDTSPS
ncbi:MAG: YibE/F family protein [Actinomycetota bacterium]